jgi:hypothetical protein
MKRIINSLRINFNHYHFILIWTLINIFQISATELTSDEGYYWFYSSKLEWGYYDHPPLLALLIKMGSVFFSGETGVRLFNVLLMSAGLLSLFKIYQWNKREKTFIYLIILSIPLFNYITFIVFPDTPLVALSIICLYAYKRLKERNDLISSLFFGLLVALMLYSKYTAIIFVFLILVSDLSLLRNKLFYISILFSVVLFIPHLLWQYYNDFPSFQYHLSGRASGFEFDNMIQFITQQIPILGIGIIFIPFIYKPENQFEKTLKYISAGTLIFFLLATFRGFVHLHWTSILLFPVIILSAKYYSLKRNNRLFTSLVIPFLFLIFIFRLYLAFRIFPVNSVNVDYYHGRKLWAEDIRAIAGGRPVVFETGNGALREAPLYSFYSKSLGIALYPGEKKKSQYQLWNYEDSIQSESVVLVKSDLFDGSSEIRTRIGKSIIYKEIDNFASFNNIKINYNVKDILSGHDSIQIPIQIINHRQNPLHFTNNQKIYILLKNKEKNEFTFEQIIDENMSIKAYDTSKLNFSFSSRDLGEEEYEFIFGIIDGITDPSINSRRGKLMVTKK